MNENKINIGKETAALLKALGLEPPFVKELHLTPTAATVTVFKKNAEGNKYMTELEHLPSLDSEEEDVTAFNTSVIATETLTFEVRT